MQRIATIAMVRRNKVIGRGTCSIYDECYDDAELQEELDRLNTTPREHLGGMAVIEFMKMINKESLSRMSEGC